MIFVQLLYLCKQLKKNSLLILWNLLILNLDYLGKDEDVI